MKRHPRTNAAHSGQAGFLHEIPLVLMVAGCILALVLPKLPPKWGAAVLATAAVGICAGLYYMIVTPGWRPGATEKPFRRRLAAFALTAVFVLASAALGVVLLLEET